MKIIVIYNPHSGSALPLGQLQDKFDAHGIAVSEFIPVQEGYEKKVKKYTTKGQIIAVYGGDGTISNVANIVAGTQAVLAPLPGGTLNHFSKDLDVPQDFDKALRRLKNGHVKNVDVAQVNHTIFINNSSIGLYPSSLQARQRFEDKLGKWPAAIIGSLRALGHYHTYDLAVSGERIMTPFIFIGNNDYFLTGAQAGRKHLDRGMLSVYIVNAASRWRLIKVFGWALVGRIADAPEIKTWTAKEVTIRSKHKKIKASRDGELDHQKTPLKYKVLAGSLRVIGSS